MMRRCSIGVTVGKPRRSKKERRRLTDPDTEADEMCHNAGEKGPPQRDAEEPPRRRAHKRRGLGPMPTERPPIQGVVGSTAGQSRLPVGENAHQQPIQPQVERATATPATVDTDESAAYNPLVETGRSHPTVCHAQREYARDDAGDGIREVHCNTREGLWTGLRNFLRPFRGVHKKYLAQYVAVFEWAHNLKAVTAKFLRLVMVNSILNPI